MQHSNQPDIPYGKHSLDLQDIQQVIDVLQSDYLTQGSSVPQFEDALCQTTHSRHAIATCNATSALHLACLALNVTQGDLVWTSPISFVASANCALYCGASIDFVDIDPNTFNLCPHQLEQKLQKANKAGQLPKAIIAVHMAGQPCDMQAIHKLSQQYGFSIIEDAAHALGAHYQGNPVGNCKYSDMTVFSFHPVKLITTGEGGAITTNDPHLAEKLRLLRSHGISKQPHHLQNTPAGNWYYEQQLLGYNYRLSDIHAALGISQIKKLTAFIEKRQQIAACYTQQLQTLPLTCPQPSKNSQSAVHLYIIQLEQAELRARIFAYMQQQHIKVQVHYIPIHLQPYFQQLGFKLGDFPHAEDYYQRAITLPVFPSLTQENQLYIIKTLKQALHYE